MSKRVKGWKFADMARRYARAHLPASAWTDKDIYALADLLSGVRMRAYGQGFNDGYQQGHDDQMKMRMADHLEHLEKVAVRQQP